MTHFNHEWDTTKTPAVPVYIDIQVGYLPIYDTNSRGQLDLSLGGI